MTLDPLGEDETLMTIEHSLLPGDLVDRHAEGWRTVAGQLADTLDASA